MSFVLCSIFQVFSQLGRPESMLVYEKGFMKLKIMRMLCHQGTLLLIVLVPRKSAPFMENVKNVLSIITRRVRIPSVQDKAERSTSLVFNLYFFYC